MTITYTLWQGSQLLAVNQKANKPEEILAVIKELAKQCDAWLKANFAELQAN